MRSTYPFIPKSSRKLSRGDFFSIPLSNGMYACGRVVECMPKGMPGAGVGFLGGVMNWRGSSAPTADAISRAAFLAQGIMHIKTILTTGGTILGNRSLELDGLDTFTFIAGATIKKGFTPVRSWRLEDNNTLPSLSWWGYDIAEAIANKYLSGVVPVGT
jgi:hypothetical protein